MRVIPVIGKKDYRTEPSGKRRIEGATQICAAITWHNLLAMKAYHKSLPSLYKGWNCRILKTIMNHFSMAQGKYISMEFKILVHQANNFFIA